MKVEKPIGQNIAIAEYEATIALIMAKIIASSESHNDLSTVTRHIRSYLESADFAYSEASQFTPTLYQKLNFPFAYIGFKRAAKKLENTGLQPREECHWKNALIKNAAHLEFSVRVNCRWYGLFKRLANQRVISARDLRSLLESSTVFWSKDGDLLIGHHWITKLSLVFLICFVACGWFYLCWWTYQTAQVSFFKALAVCVIYSFGVFLPTWLATWRIGPSSWKAAKTLPSLLGITVAQ